MKQQLEKIIISSRNIANNKIGVWLIFILAAADSSLLPMPITTMFIVLSFLDTTKVYKYALFITMGTLAGAVIGYYTGRLVWINSSGDFTGFAKTIFNNIPGISEKGYNEIHILFTKWDYRILFLAVCTPIPYCLFSIPSGIFDINIFVFIIATIISHGIKFLFLAILISNSGNLVKKLPVRKLRRIALISTKGIVIVIFVSNLI